MNSRTIRLAVVGGDGIGPEVTAEALKVLSAATGAAAGAATPGVSIDETNYDLGARRWHRTGETLPDAVLEEIKGHDAILLGAVGDPSVPSGVLERGLLLRLRFELDHYVNLRPVRLYPGVATPLAAARPETLDMVVVREGTEGPYVGNGGALRVGTPAEIATEVSVNTAYGVERVVRDAFARWGIIDQACWPPGRSTDGLVVAIDPQHFRAIGHAGQSWRKRLSVLNETLTRFARA